MSWALPVLLTTLRLNWRVHPSPQSRCWAPCRQVPRSKRRSPTEHTDVATQQGLPHHTRSNVAAQHAQLSTTEDDPVPNWDASQGPTQKAMTMNFSLPAELLEATRLTKAGQLTEATAALQRMLGAGLPVNSVALQGRQGPPTLDGMVDGP